MSRYRTHGCGELGAEHVGAQVVLSGWIHRVRELGGLTFVVLRDASGLVQLAIDPNDRTEDLRPEATARVTGVVRARPGGASNAEMATGAIEVEASTFEVLASCATLPFTLHEGPAAGEQIRLEHRYLDLRRAKMRRNMELRDEVIAHMRRWMRARGFMEVQTPILTASSPEGARDYLVPSRLHPGAFYALPQAPQQFKQLLMASGVERYFQIAPCFRDESSRADRSPGEFYQLDLEMAFVEQEEIFEMVEALMIELFETYGNREVPRPFPRIPYAEAIARYGSDKPDLRFGVELQRVDASFTECALGFLRGPATSEEGAVVALVAPGFAGATRKQIEALEARARQVGGGGVAWLGVTESGERRGSLGKKLTDAEVAALMALPGAEPGCAVLLLAGGRAHKVCEVAGQIRLELGRTLGLIDTSAHRFAWIVDFPMYERDEETGEVVFSHNPFSMPQGGLEALRTKDPLDVLAYQYDIVCDGLELSSGAIRNHRPDLMIEAFGIAGYPADEVERQFGALYKAFQFGPPPHGGIAPGVERILMLLTDAESIRDVVPFPMNQRAQDVMMGAPARVSQAQLDELRIALVARED